MMPRLSAFFLGLVFFINLPGAESPEFKPKNGISITRFIPGVSQLLSGKTVKGGMLLGAFLVTITGAIIENSQGNGYYEQYLNSTDVDEIVQLREKAERSFQNRNYYLLGICGIWLVHALDMKIFKTRKGVIKGEAKDHSVCVGFYYFF